MRMRTIELPSSVAISIGSNLGLRRSNLRRALEGLGRLVQVTRLSSVWETEPIGGDEDASPYLNLVVAGHTTLDPKELLSGFHQIERALGRRRRHRNEPRRIDIDLILHGSRLVRSRKVTVPHPRYRDREFVLAPLRELELAWVDPTTGRRHRCRPRRQLLSARRGSRSSA